MSQIELRTGWEIERERLDFKRDRVGTNGYPGATPHRVTYMAHAKGYVMVRHPGCIPFTVTEKDWLSFPYWEKPALSDERASPAKEG